MCLEFLSERGPVYGYYIEPEKTHVICTEADEPQARAAFLIEGSNGELFKRAAVPRRIYW
jgi:hypothetical protein